MFSHCFLKRRPYHEIGDIPLSKEIARNIFVTAKVCYEDDYMCNYTGEIVFGKKNEEQRRGWKKYYFFYIGKNDEKHEWVLETFESIGDPIPGRPGLYSVIGKPYKWIYICLQQFPWD